MSTDTRIAKDYFALPQEAPTYLFGLENMVQMKEEISIDRDLIVTKTAFHTQAFIELETACALAK